MCMKTIRGVSLKDETVRKIIAMGNSLDDSDDFDGDSWNEFFEHQAELQAQRDAYGYWGDVMFNIYLEMIKDCIEFCNKAEAFVKKQKELMEGKDDGKDFKKLSQDAINWIAAWIMREQNDL